MARKHNPLLTDDELAKLRAQFYVQLPIVAAIFAATQATQPDYEEAVEEALLLVDALLLAMEEEEE